MLDRSTDIGKRIRMIRGQTVAVEEFSVEGAQVSDDADDWYKDWRLDIQGTITNQLVDRLNSAGFAAKRIKADEESQSDYRIKGHFVQIDSGNKGTRVVSSWLGGGSAGKAFISIEGEVLKKDDQIVFTYYHKEVPPQSFVTDSSGAFNDAIAETVRRFANEFIYRTQ